MTKYIEIFEKTNNKLHCTSFKTQLNSPLAHVLNNNSKYRESLSTCENFTAAIARSLGDIWLTQFLQQVRRSLYNRNSFLSEPFSNQTNLEPLNRAIRLVFNLIKPLATNRFFYEKEEVWETMYCWPLKLQFQQPLLLST